MRTFGQVVVRARKAAGLTQKAVAERLRRGDGRRVLPPWLNDLEHVACSPRENAVIEQLAQVLKVSTDFLYFHARRLPANIEGNFDEGSIEEAYRAFRNQLQLPPTADQHTRPSRINSHSGAWAKDSRRHLSGSRQRADNSELTIATPPGLTARPPSAALFFRGFWGSGHWVPCLSMRFRQAKLMRTEDSLPKT